MYIHLGNNNIISYENIIAILNIKPPISKDLKEFIETIMLEKEFLYIGDKGQEKALIICADKVYLSPISTTTLLRRAKNFYKEV